MKVFETTLFNKDFPEEYPWSELDNITACNVSMMIAARIRLELRRPPSERHDLPGLRRALVVMSEYMEA